MKNFKTKSYLAGLFLFAVILSLSFLRLNQWQYNTDQSVRAGESIQELSNKIPLYFIENNGQQADEVDFYLDTQQGSVYFAGEKTVSVLTTQADTVQAQAIADPLAIEEVEQFVVTKYLLNSCLLYTSDAADE